MCTICNHLHLIIKTNVPINEISVRYDTIYSTFYVATYSTRFVRMIKKIRNKVETIQIVKYQSALFLD